MLDSGMNTTPSDQDDIREKLDSILAQIRNLHTNGSAPWQGAWLRIPDAAKYLSTSEKTIRRLVLAGKLKPFRPIGGVIVLHREEIDRFVKTTAGRRSTRGRRAGAANG